MNVLRLIAVSVLVLFPLEAESQAVPDQPDWAKAEVITVQLSNFKFNPATIHLKHGVAYDLRLQNLASGGHNFAAQEFFAGAQIKADDRAKVDGGKVALNGGQTIDLHFFSPRAGTYKVHCTHFMHSAFGMTGEIVVQ